MSIHVALHHRTHYRYDRLVALSPQIVRLRPAPHSRTRVLSYSLRVTPEKHFLNWQQDPQSNYLARLVFPEPARALCVEVDLVAEMAVLNPFDFFLEPQAERFPFQYDQALDHELAPFLLRLPPTPEFTKYLGVLKREMLGITGATLPAGRPGQSPPDAPAQTEESLPRTIDVLVQINQRLRRDLRYVIRLEPGVQTPEETLQLASGSCRDSAWLLCQLLRHLGLAARFVSGYLIQLTADVKSLDGPSGPERDFTDLHAWCEVYLPGAGWIGLDPTSGLLAGEGHLPLACAPDPTSAAPITGLVEACECEFSHDMTVTRLFESPRVTKPYTEEQWQRIEALGHQLDTELERNDCRLTMGGEPTFVSLDDRDGAEWSMAALGPTKRRLADDLMRRLKSRLTTGALLHYSLGKWYPGESLPRWAFAAYWRKDGQPVWVNDALFADETTRYGFDERRAETFLRTLAGRVGCGTQWIMPAFEDTWYYLWKERRLPTNVDPFQSQLKNEEDRARLARVFEQGLDKAVGYVLPIQRECDFGGAYWASGPWFFRPARCYLIPGDSPLGLRLPLDSLPHVAPGECPHVGERDPLEARSPLPSHAEFRQPFLPAHRPRAPQPLLAGRGPHGLGPDRGVAHGSVGTTPGARVARGQGGGKERQSLDDPTRAPARGESAPWIVRTALCVEPREGRLYVFMPPTQTLEDYLSLVTAVEDTAVELDTPVVVEGYPPPRDPRLQVLKITPDPGVIEVNLHPARSWDEMVRHTEILYEEARQARLGTEKFMLDGKHSGTGGGNHIVIGGPTPADSPLLRRPELLRSLLTYWQNHPSLSFLFSGLFIGPTSQSPRVDEARNDSLYELELAFRELDRQLGARLGSSPRGAAGTADPGRCTTAALSRAGGATPTTPEETPAPPFVPPWLVDRLFRNLLIDATGNTHRAEFCIDKLYPPETGGARLGLLEMRAFEMPPHARMSLAQQLLLRTLIAKFWKQPYTQGLVRWGTSLHDRWMLPHFIWSDFAEVIADLQEAGYPLSLDWFAPHFEFRFPSCGDLEVRNVRLEFRQALEPWHVLGEEPGAGGTVRYVDSSVERLQVKATGLVDGRHVVAVNGAAVPLHPTGTQGEYVAGVRYRAWQPPHCLQPTIGVHTPLVFDLVDTWNGRSVGGCTYHVAHPGGRNHTTFPVNAYEAESRRLARFFRLGHTPGPLAPRMVERQHDFPLTLDLRAV